MKLLNIVVGVLELLIGASAIVGGIGLIVTNGLGMQVTQLRFSPFTSFTLPGIILAGVVGGSYMVAAISVFIKSKYRNELQAVAGFGLLIWVFTELYMIRQPHFLQALYFCIGILTLIFSLFLYKIKKND